MDIATWIRRVAETCAWLACCAALGCVEPQEYADLRSEREIYIQKHLPEVHLVLSDFDREIALHEARMSDRAAKLSANGRSQEGDSAYRRWYGLHEDMTRDRDKLSRIADDVYFKFDEYQLAGNEDLEGQEDLAGLMEEARSTAAELRDRLDTYRSKLSGATSETAIADDGSRTGISLVFDDRTETIDVDDDGGYSYGPGDDSVFVDDAPMEPGGERTLVAAPDDEISRSWHDASGEFGVSALFRGISDPYTDDARVWLRRDGDGGTISIPYDSLSEEDREYVDRRYVARRLGG